MSSILAGIGVASPPFCFSQSRIHQFMQDAHGLNRNESQRLKKLYDLSGINTRYSVLSDFGSERGNYTFFGNEPGLHPFPTTKERGLVYEKEAAALGVQAVEHLSEQLPGLNLKSITHLITVSCTGMYAPGLDIDLVEKLQLDKNTERTCINFMGCYGAFNAIKAADYICRASSTSKVLIVAVELCTLHFQRENSLENWLSNSLFGDGASAMLVESSEGSQAGNGFRLKSFYNELALEAKDEMGWRIGDSGFEMRLSSRIAKNIKSKIGDVTDKLLKKAGLGLGDITGFAVHPGGRRILEVSGETLRTTCLKHSFDILKQYGNMSSVTVLFVLLKFLKEAKPGEHIMSFAFGPGLTFESMILETV
jgi:predicted naringenin-chalcone synthase